MNVAANEQHSAEIAAKLTALRSRIRYYVVFHGLFLAATWVCLSYWVVLALDYVPVTLGFHELPRGVRLVLLAAIGLVLAWILYAWVFRRTWVQLSDQGLALVLERRFPELNDSLVTTVETGYSGASQPEPKAGLDGDAVSPGEPSQEMLESTRQLAEHRLSQISLNDVFDFRPILVTGISTLLLVSSLLTFVAYQPEAFTTSLRRLYLLDDSQWPRQCHVELVGIKVRYENANPKIPSMNQALALNRQSVTVGQGSNVTLLVAAEAPTTADSKRKLPRSCVFQFRSDDGSSGTLPMTKIGGIRDGKQMYSLEGFALDGILSDISFSIRGGDHRIGPFKIRTVPNPTITQTKLHCQYPPYMVDQESLRWTARTIDWNNGVRLPYGTHVTVEATSNRDLKKVYVLDAQGELVETISMADLAAAPQATRFEFDIDSLDDDFNLSYLLEDTDGVISQRPSKITIGMIEDLPPNVETLLNGIGTAVTPDVRIPLSGQIQDDYGVRRAWVEIVTPAAEPIQVDCQIKSDGELSGLVDFRQIRRDSQTGFDLPTGPESQLSIEVRAADHFDLDGQDGHQGVGDRFVVDIVTPDRLLRILERLEAAQRRRLEQIYQEMTEARQYLVRAGRNSGTPQAGFEPGDRRQNENRDPQIERVELLELQQLYGQRALLQTQKSTQEILGVAESFADIRMQLINNRVDSQDRKLRLEKQVVAPLLAIGNQSLPLLEQQLIRLDNQFLAVMREATSRESSDELERLSLESLNRTDAVLQQIQAVLDSLKKFETQNELLEIVRRMIADQEKLIQRTKAERNREAFERLTK